MTVIIGIDPHKASHAACAIDDNEHELAQLSVRAGQRQLEQLLGWAQPFPERTWAIESAGGLGYLLAQQLVAAGECVVDVPATLSSRVRLLGTGRSNKNDPNDARAVAIAALRAPRSRRCAVRITSTVLRLLAKAHLDLGRARSRACCRLHALARGAGRGWDPQRSRCFTGRNAPRRHRTRRRAAQRQRLELAHELLDEIRALDARLKGSKQRIADRGGRVRHDAHRPLRRRAGHRRDRARLQRRHRAGSRPPATTPLTTAPRPIELSSGGRTVHRLSRRGNRTLNHAMHMIAVTQIRNRDSEGRGYYDTKTRGREDQARSDARVEAQDQRPRLPTARSPTPVDRSGRTIRERLSHPA